MVLRMDSVRASPRNVIGKISECMRGGQSTTQLGDNAPCDSTLRLADAPRAGPPPSPIMMRNRASPPRSRSASRSRSKSGSFGRRRIRAFADSPMEHRRAPASLSSTMRLNEIESRASPRMT